MYGGIAYCNMVVERAKGKIRVRREKKTAERIRNGVRQKEGITRQNQTERNNIYVRESSISNRYFALAAARAAAIKGARVLRG